MNYRFSPKTSGSSSLERDKNKRKGTVLIVTIFLFLAFSTLALGLIYLSQVYLQIGGYEKNSSRLDYCSENGIKEGFHHLAAAIGSAPSPAVISEERYIELRDDARGLGKRLLEEAAGILFPVQIQAQEETMIWQSRTDCLLEKVVEKGDFFLAVYSLPVQAEGRLRSLPFRRPTSLQARAEVLAGRIPLSALPFLLNKTLSPEERRDFVEENDITLLPSSRQILPSQVSFADAPLIPQSAAPFLEKALDIEIFRPQDMTAAKLRSVLGLEESQDPVPEGVYLIRNDLGLAGIYVQGDVQEMVAAVEGSFQVILFRLGDGVWILRYSPAESKTSFRSPQGEETFDLVPLGLIIISGEVLSLGGGVVEAGGEVRLVADREVPSILPGVNLTLVASGTITITSHLIQQGLSWQEGIPYLKSEQAQLVIFSTGRDLWTEEAIEGGIVIAQGAPQDLKVQAALTAGGEGLKVEGENKSVRVLGGIQTTAYSSSGNPLSLTPWAPRFDSENAALLAPQAAQPVLLITRFGASEWKEY
jgi:hypothetical protein